MREVTLKIPEEKFEFYLELFEQLGLETEFEYEIPEEHKEIVRERIRNANENPDQLLDWDEVKDDFDFK
ncbi:addiction module protein [Aquiflexum sp.]|uniref:addiction module protein n=1 Tax=Aquiflexum sp. TaxID=1872584 RepID=UPI00359319F4